LRKGSIRATGTHWSPRGINGNPRFRELVAGACAPNAQGFVSDPVNCINRGQDYNLDGTANDRPNAAHPNPHISDEQWANGWNLPDFFSAPCLGCVGILGRNSFTGPGYWAADISLFKSVEFTEGVKLQIRAEAFNVLNRTNFQTPGAKFSGTTFIDLPQTQFGRAGGTHNPRNLQFGLRLSF
jgi:hypothetical protein